LDPERQAAVIPLIPRSVEESLPAKPGYYETSPDGKRIAILADKGAVAVLTLATGALDTVQAPGDDDTVSAPAWRSASELCFISTTNGRPAQVALWDNGTTRVLSANWPAAARKGFLDK
jgi:WD40 repeat protein